MEIGESGSVGFVYLAAAMLQESRLCGAYCGFYLCKKLMSQTLFLLVVVIHCALQFAFRSFEKTDFQFDSNRLKTWSTGIERISPLS
jgi:hypothetical protein